MPKILIVDDKEENRYVLRNFFKLFGPDSKIEILEAGSGKEVVEKLEKEKADLVIMDIKMETDHAGLEATKKIREIDDNKKITIWALTSQAMEEHEGEQSDREKCLKAGCDDYITKPFNQVELIQKIAGLLNLEIPRKTKVRMGIE